MPWQRAILHVDMDAFFAAIAVRDNPDLAGLPVLTGGFGTRGVVTTASYEARRFGCRSAMPTAVALRLCPQAVRVKNDSEAIRDAASRVREALAGFTPLVQPVSVDEAYLDVTASQRLMGEPMDIAAAVRARVAEATGGLSCSVGVACNKMLAKLASDAEKPGGRTVVQPGWERAFLDPLPIAALPGVGQAALKRFERLSIRTVGQLHRTPVAALRSVFGPQSAAHLERVSAGIDDRPVVTDRETKSISHEQTFSSDLGSPADVRAFIVDQAEQVARRLRRAERYARTVSIKVRTGGFETVTRARTLQAPTRETGEIASTARELFEAWSLAGFSPVRLIGVGVSQLSADPPEPLLFDAPGERAPAARRAAADAAADLIAARFGKRAVVRGSALAARAGHEARPGYVIAWPDGRTEQRTGAAPT